MGQTDSKSHYQTLPVIDINLDIVPQRSTSMLLDTGAEVSLINQKAIQDKTLINPQNRISINSLHGSERTLGDISANICKNNDTIPIKLQVTNNSFIKEDGILGFDFLGENGIVNGPTKTVTFSTRNSVMNYPFQPQSNYISTINEEIRSFFKIEYLSDEEKNPQYEANLRTVKTITRQINHLKIEINPIKK